MISHPVCLRSLITDSACMLFAEQPELFGVTAHLDIQRKWSVTRYLLPSTELAPLEKSIVFCYSFSWGPLYKTLNYILRN